ncbi:response regulator transcription factor [Sulfurospirillum sp. 1612]|uniref:response regulator transcription factor n=1 Tax=Sulfurospirillum sp. 1612 TaxID=3094835 RepID=UPI002F95A499
MKKNVTRVLLVEDEADAREILSFYLNTIFEDVVTAVDGAIGYETFQKELEAGKTFDLVLTDIKMPNLNGMDMIEQMLALRKEQKFIIVSAYKDEEKLLKSINFRVLGYFLKPINVDNMMKILSKAKEQVLKEKEQSLISDAIVINTHYTYYPKRKLLYCDDEWVKLSKQETQLLDILANNIGNITTIETFKLALWNDINKSDVTFRTVMKRLKDKIGKEDFILSLKGQGYMIEKK